MNEQLEQALDQIAEEKGISREDLISMIEASLAAAFRKDYGEKNQNIVVEFDPETMGTKVFDVKTVVENESEAEEKIQSWRRNSYRNYAEDRHQLWPHCGADG